MLSIADLKRHPSTQPQRKTTSASFAKHVTIQDGQDLVKENAVTTLELESLYTSHHRDLGKCPSLSVHSTRRLPPQTPSLHHRPQATRPSLPPMRTANISRPRRRTALLHLASTPPRASYSTQVTGIFTQQHASAATGSHPRNRMRQDLLPSPTSSNSSSGGVAVVEHVSCYPSPRTHSTILIGEIPINVPYPPRVAEEKVDDEESSEAWTGDEDFLPRSARKRHRAERLAARLAREREAASNLCSVLSPAPVLPKRFMLAASARATRFMAVTEKAQPGEDRIQTCSEVRKY